MEEKYNLNQLRGAYGAGYYAGKKAEEKVTLTFEEFGSVCIGCEIIEMSQIDEPKMCGISTEPIPDIGCYEKGVLCNAENCPFWAEWKKEGKIT